MIKASCSVIIASGGKGERSGLPYPKQLYKLGNKEILLHTIEKFADIDFVDEIIIVSDESILDYTKELCGKTAKVKKTIAGASLRQASVYEGLKAVSDDAEIVLVHDAVRPFVSSDLIKRVYEGALAHGACIPGLIPKDTVKKYENGFVTQTLDRGTIVLAQTPQGFRKEILVSAHNSAAEHNIICTDDSALAERIGAKVYVTDGDEENIKLTTAHDIELSRAYPGNPAMPAETL